MARIVRVLPPDLTTLLFTAGDRKIILVEGVDDQDAFEAWYPDREAKVIFYPAGSSANVETFLPLALSQSARKRIYGIVDRDFRSDAEANAWRSDPSAHLFVLPRYELENYLLEPAVVNDELRAYYGRTLAAPGAAGVEADLLRLCQELCPIMAANWVFQEVGGVTYFEEGFPGGNRSLVVQESAKRLGCTPDEADQQIAAKETLIYPNLGTLATAHAYIRGKHLLHAAYLRYISRKRGLPKDSFRNYLVRAAARHGLHPDVTTIIEERIFAAP